jgi:hypothetical protein
MAQVMVAGGELTIADPKPDVRHWWRQGIYEATPTDLAPGGKRLRHRGSDQGDLVVWLEDTKLASGPVPQYPEVTVPERVGRYHLILAATRAEVGGRRTGTINTYRDAGMAHVNVSAAAFPRARHCCLEPCRRHSNTRWAESRDTRRLKMRRQTPVRPAPGRRPEREIRSFAAKETVPQSFSPWKE